MANDFSIDTGSFTTFSYIRMNGAMSAKNILTIRQAFDLLSKNANSIVIDLSNVTMLDSMGVGIIVNFYRIVTGKKGKLAVVCPGNEAKEILELADLDRLFPLYNSMEEAQQKF